MYNVIVTGGIGSGKSIATKRLHSHGAAVLDLDEVARGVISPYTPTYKSIIEEFCEGIDTDPEGNSQFDILREDDSIDTALLAKRAFATRESAQRLNNITFPAIMNEVSEYVLNVHCTPLSNAPALVIEVPLLPEAPDFKNLADEVIMIDTPEVLRRERLFLRGMSADDIDARIAVQSDREEYLALADTVMVNDDTPDKLEAAIDTWWRTREEEGRFLD